MFYSMYEYDSKQLYRVRVKVIKKTNECVVLSYEKGINVSKHMEFPIVTNYGFYFENTYTVDEPDYKIHNYVIEMSKHTYNYRYSDSKIGNGLYILIYGALLNKLREEKINKVLV